MNTTWDVPSGPAEGPDEEDENQGDPAEKEVENTDGETSIMCKPCCPMSFLVLSVQGHVQGRRLPASRPATAQSIIRPPCRALTRSWFWSFKLLRARVGAAAAIPVSINEASMDRLVCAVSSVMAENIIQIREARPFASVQDCSALLSSTCQMCRSRIGYERKLV